MSKRIQNVLVSADAGLLAHWQSALGKVACVAVANLQELQELSLPSSSIVWLDLALPGVPKFSQPSWAVFLKIPSAKWVATNSCPNDNEAIEALDAGCAAYCHAFSDAATLRQIRQVVKMGQVWIGQTLMQRLVQSATKAARFSASDQAPSWHTDLTEREQQIAILASNAASNAEIARTCSISERTVKAHLSSIFVKLNLTDRLQLALRVHGIS